MVAMFGLMRMEETPASFKAFKAWDPENRYVSVKFYDSKGQLRFFVGWPESLNHHSTEKGIPT